MTVKTNKIGSVLKNIRLKKKIKTQKNIKCLPGTVIAVKVLKVNQKYNKLELFNGRQVVLTEGDIVIGCLGSRMASSGMTGNVPKEIKPFDRIHILNLGGLIGSCKDFNILLGGPTECEVVGSVVNDENKQLNIDQFKQLQITSKLKSKVPVVAVLGTGIDSGKTTVSSFMIRVLKSYFKTVNACKLAGSAAQKDLCSFEDNGAKNVYDFVDAGLPSTNNINPKIIVNAAKSIINHTSKNSDVVFAELGDGLHGEYGTKQIVSDKEIQKIIKVYIICALDFPGAINILESLKTLGIKNSYFIISGPLTNNYTVIQNSLVNLGKENIDIINVFKTSNHTNVFAKIINRINK